jgi:uncharacterized membrane protein
MEHYFYSKSGPISMYFYAGQNSKACVRFHAKQVLFLFLSDILIFLVNICSVPTLEIKKDMFVKALMRMCAP